MVVKNTASELIEVIKTSKLNAYKYEFIDSDGIKNTNIVIEDKDDNKVHSYVYKTFNDMGTLDDHLVSAKIIEVSFIDMLKMDLSKIMTGNTIDVISYVRFVPSLHTEKFTRA